MKGISAKGWKEYWSRREYHRLNGSDRRRSRVEAGATRRRRFWRIKVATKIRIPKIPSPKKLLLCLRDAYVRMMMGLANSRVTTAYGYGYGYGYGRTPVKEYDDNMIVQIYNSLVMAQRQLGTRDAPRISSL